MAVTFTLVAGGGAGEASHLAVAALGGFPEFITAMQNGSGNLELIGWAVRDNTLARVATALGPAVNNVALTTVSTGGTERAVTAVGDGSGKLFLTSWDCNHPLTSITKAGDSSAATPHPGAADLIGITSALSEFGQPVLVTALRNGSGNLELISWRLETSGNLTRLADSGSHAGGVESVAVTAVGGNLVVTAVQTTHSILHSNGKLKLIAWRVTGGGAITRIGDEDHLYGEAGEVSEVAIAPISGFGFSGVLTAVKNGSGNLEVIAWSVDQFNGFKRLGDNMTPPNTAGTASHIAISHAGNVAERYLTSMRRGTGDLELIAFDFTPPSSPVKRMGDHGSAQGNDVTETALAHLADGRAIVADRLRNFLNVQLWQLT